MKVPQYRRSQDIQVSGFPQVSIQGREDIFAVQELGQTVQDLGSIIKARQEQRKQEIDAIEVNEAFYGQGGLVDQVTELTRGYTDLKEKNAYGASLKYNEELGKVTRKWLDGFSDGEQRKKAEGLALIYGNRKRGEVYKHESVQHQAAKKTTISTALVGSLKRVQDRPDEVEDTIKLFEAVVGDVNTGVDNTKLLFDAENKIRDAAEKANLENKKAIVWSAALLLPLGDGLKLIEKSPLPHTAKMQVLRDYKTTKEIEKKQFEKAEKEEIKQIQDDFIRRLNDETNPTTLAQIDASKLDPVGMGSKAWFRDKIEKRANSQKDTFTEYDPEELSRIKKKVNTSPESVDILNDIWSPVGKGKEGGIKPEQAQELQNTLDKRLKNTPRAKRLGQAQSMLDKFRGKYGWSEDPLENDTDYFKWQDAIDQYDKENPDKDVLVWLQEQMKPAEQNLIERLLNIATLGFAFKPEIKEPPERKEKSFKIKTVIKTGTAPDGRKVIQYSDGSIDYAD